MRSQEILDVIAESENATVEFKEDTIRAERLAREIVAFANGPGWKDNPGCVRQGQDRGCNNVDNRSLNTSTLGPKLERLLVNTQLMREGCNTKK